MKTKLQAFFRFLITKVFLLNLLGAIVVSSLIYLIVMNRVNSYVDPDNYIKVGWYYGMDVRDAEREIKKLNLKVEVDSVFVEGVEPGTVIKQEPYPSDSAGFKVKPGRTVILTVQSYMAPGVEIPMFEARSLRIVIAKMQSRRLRTRVSYVPHEYDYVLSASYNGKALKEGMKVPIGSTINLVAGQGRPQAVEVPDLNGMTISEATLRLSSASLKLHVVECEGCFTSEDSSAAFVIRQSPSGGRNSFSSAGNDVSVWFSINDEEPEE